jgi:hypothetical protein
MKVKRKVITENNKAIIEELYNRAEREPHTAARH